MTGKPNPFDRVRPRTADALDSREVGGPESVDADGKRALFSQTSAPPAFGSVALDCSSCGAESVLTPAQWVRAALPSVHVPLLKKKYWSYMRCPACGKRTWLRPRFRV